MQELVRVKLPDGECLNHVESPLVGDYTLCGLSLDGDDGSGGGAEISHPTRGKINCPDCVKFIRFCKTVPAKKLAADQ